MDISVREHIDLTGRCVSVIGAGRSGIAASKLLAALDAKVFLSDRNPNTGAKWRLGEIYDLGVVTEFGKHSDRIYEADLIVVSPGVRQDSDIILTAESRGIPVVSEVELASWYTRLPIVAVTGSNGKTTTATIIAQMCNLSSYTPYLAGNIGIPFSKVVADNLGNEPENGILVLEISSFQMERIHHFKPKVVVLLNLTADHLDRYSSMNDYAAAKMRILENVTEEDYLVYNADDQTLTDWIDTSARKVPFTLRKNPSALFSVNQTKIHDENQEIVVHLNDISLPGKHNVGNFLAAATVCKIFDVPLDVIRKVMTTFSGVPHRIEHVCTIDGIDYYNDSKATNVDSVVVALDCFSRPTILILGGRHKEADFSNLLPYLTPHVKLVLVIGEASGRIIAAIGDVVTCVRMSTLESAVRAAHEEAQSGDIVLLSPGCASFDMFNSFEQRGDVFKQAVAELQNS